MTQIPNGQNQMDQELVQAKRQFEKLMLQFVQFLQDTILAKNKSQGQLKAESDFMTRLLVSANELDQLNPFEGTYGLLTLMIREGFVLRDKNNEMEYKQQELQREINKLKAQLADRNRGQQG